MGTILQCRDVHKRFPHRDGFVHALSGVTVDFAEKEWVGIKGYSGSGKSTLLNVISGIEEPSSGTVEFLGHTYAQLGPNGLARLRRKWIGIVLQETALIGHLTAEENIELPGLLSGRKLGELRTRSESLVDLLRLQGRKSHYPSEMSGGERQRVAIARALMTEDAKVLIADEPTANLDARSTREVGEAFRKLVQGGMCVITASHDDRLLNQADRLLTIEDGKLASQEDAV